jgi:hypothetical protein
VATRTPRLRVLQLEGERLSGEQESVPSDFTVWFLTVEGKGLTVIGPPEALEALQARLKDAADVELHRFDRQSEVSSS